MDLKERGNSFKFANSHTENVHEDLDIYLSSNGNYAVEILSKKVCNFDNIDHGLICEDDDNKKTVKINKTS